MYTHTHTHISIDPLPKGAWYMYACFSLQITLQERTHTYIHTHTHTYMAASRHAGQDAHTNKAPSSNPWSLLDPHDATSANPRPFRRGKTSRRPKNGQKTDVSCALPKLVPQTCQMKSLKMPYFPGACVCECVCVRVYVCMVGASDVPDEVFEDASFPWCVCVCVCMYGWCLRRAR